LPTGEGFFCEHPSNPSARRAPGYHHVNERGNTMMMETGTWEEADDAVQKAMKYAPGRGTNDVDTRREHERREDYDLGLHNFFKKNFQMRFSIPEGRSDALLSLSLGEDIWHILTVDMSLPRLLLLEVLIEFTFIFIGSVALTSVAAAEGQDLDSDLLSSKLMLSLTTVRISSDAIFGWAERTPSTKPEIAVLALLGWFHWLLLSVAGAIIVARALRPLQQVAFAPDCAINEMEVAIRMTVLRRTVVIYDVQVKMMVTIRGMRHNLPMARGLTSYDHISAIPMTFKHDITDENSPLYNRDFSTVQSIGISVRATDDSGNPVIAHAVYYNPKSWVAGKPEFQALFANRSPFPRILRGNFADQIRMFRLPNSEATYVGSSVPMWMYNMENFSRVVPLEEQEDETV
jgi:hypothetical protein